MNRFVLKMAWREGRGAWRRFLFFLFCVALGVGSIVGVGNLAANLEEMTFHEARNILAADLEPDFGQQVALLHFLLWNWISLLTQDANLCSAG